MSDIILRSGKGSPLTNAEIDANFTNLNTDKLEKSGETASFADLTLQSVSSTLHRSPNAITALFVYDTSKDSDGGAWTEKCQHTSWYNETIYGKWLGAQASEAAARAVSGATTDDYYQLTTDGKFYKLNATSGVTEVFRGNKRAFPKLAAIVSDADSITIYDLVEAGRPMWMVFRSRTDNLGMFYTLTLPIRVAWMLESVLVVGQASIGLRVINFKSEKTIAHRGTTVATFVGTFLGGISARQSGAFDRIPLSPTLANSDVNAVAMTVLPDAPLDPATGLKIPTIAVATGGGLSLIQNTGTVRNSSSTLAFTQVTLTPQLLSAGRADAVWYYAANPGSLGASFALTTKNASTATDFNVGNTTLLKAKDRANYARTSSAVVQLLRNNEGTIGKGIAAKLSDTYNTGWLVGDIRRAYLASNAAGSVTGPELVTNGTFNTDTTGWGQTANISLSVSSGQLTMTTLSGANYTEGVYQIISGLVVGRIYEASYTVVSATARVRILITSPYTQLYSTSGTRLVFVATATNTRMDWVVDSNAAGAVVTIDNISVKEVIPDRSYKAAASTINGTLTATAVNTGNDLVAYSGFSAANYIREEYHPDLDFGTGEWSCSAWVNNSSGPRYNILTYTEQFDNAAWTKTNTTVTQNATTAPDGTLTADTLTPTTTGFQASQAYLVSGTYTASVSVKDNGAGSCAVAMGTGAVGYLINVNLTTGAYISGRSYGGGSLVSYSILSQGNGWWRVSVIATATHGGVTILKADGTNPTSGIYVWGAQLVPTNEASLPYQRVVSGTETFSSIIAERAYSSGPSISLSLINSGNIRATAYDGTTTRTVTTTAAYNTATWIKADAQYTTDGKLAILVNGVEVASTTGTPLLTLNNSNAVLTIGNSYALDAPFPGSIALLKFSATVPTAEQATWMYEQEKHLFSTGAKCVLPASTSVLDLAYDDATDTWSTLQATHESSFSGLVRTSTQAPSAGSFSKSTAASGVKLLGRTTTNPGVDVQMPAKNLRSKDMPKDTNQDIVVFDFDAVTSQTDFLLPVGYEAKAVLLAGALQREGPTKNYVKKFDGFRETVAFGTAPGNGSWVQIHAVKEVSL